MLMLSLFTLPSPSDIIASTSAFSGPFFLEFLPLLALVGIVIAAMFFRRLYKSVKGGAKMALGTGGGKGRGRRR